MISLLLRKEFWRNLERRGHWIRYFTPVKVISYIEINGYCRRLFLWLKPFSINKVRARIWLQQFWPGLKPACATGTLVIFCWKFDLIRLLSQLAECWSPKQAPSEQTSWGILSVTAIGAHSVHDVYSYLWLSEDWQADLKAYNSLSYFMMIWMWNA